MTERTVQPYLFLGGRCEEALEFYRSALGAEIEMMSRFRDAPGDLDVPDAHADKILHATFHIGATTLMASDGFGESKPISGISLSLALDDEAEARRSFDALADGGDVTMPLGPTFWSPCFGMVTDRFGVSWMVNVAHPA